MIGFDFIISYIFLAIETWTFWLPSSSFTRLPWACSTRLPGCSAVANKSCHMSLCKNLWCLIVSFISTTKQGSHGFRKGDVREAFIILESVSIIYLSTLFYVLPIGAWWVSSRSSPSPWSIQEGRKGHHYIIIRKGCCPLILMCNICKKKLAFDTLPSSV